jgi:hypothetical protein
VTISGPILEAIRLSFSNSITAMFLVGAGIVLLAIVASALIKSVPLKSAEEYHEVASREPIMEEPSAIVPSLEANKPARKGNV